MFASVYILLSHLGLQLSSIAHRKSRAAAPGIKFREVEDFNGEFADDPFPDWSRYCQYPLFYANASNPIHVAMTKLANVLWMRELQRRLNAMGAAITCMPINPGSVNTFAARMPFPWVAAVLFALFFAIPEVGAYTSCFATAASEVRDNPEKFKGAFLEPVGIVTPPSEVARRDELAEELWETTERILEDLRI